MKKKLKSYWRVCEVAARFCRDEGDIEMAAYFDSERHKFKHCTQLHVTQLTARELIELKKGGYL